MSRVINWAAIAGSPIPFVEDKIGVVSESEVWFWYWNSDGTVEVGTVLCEDPDYWVINNLNSKLNIGFKIRKNLPYMYVDGYQEVTKTWW